MVGAVMIEFHGGPSDGVLFETKRSKIGEHLVQVGRTQNVMQVCFPTVANENHYHVYWSNGPIDFPLLEDWIDLYYEGIKE